MQNIPMHHICVVVQKYGLVGGGEKFVFEITERLSFKPDLHIHVLANKWRSQNPNISFHQIPILRFPRFAAPISFASNVKRRLVHVDPDIVHTHDRIWRADVYTLHGIPHIAWMRDVRKKRLSLFDRSYAHIERHLVQNSGCRYFLPVSSITRNAFLNEFLADPERIRTIYPGVDIKPFQQFEPEQCRLELRRRLNISSDAVILLFVSMNFDIKGLDHVITGLARARRHANAAPLQLVVVGKGDPKKYKQAARQDGISKYIHFMGIVEKNIEKIYLASDMFILLSRFDTFALVVLEAMAASLPVIISDRVGAKDIVTDGDNGFVVNRKDSEKVASCLLQMMDRDRRSKMSAKAAETASRYSWDAAADSVYGVYQEVLRYRQAHSI